MVKVFNFEKKFRSNEDFCCNTYIVGEEGGPCVIIDLGEKFSEVANYVKKHHTRCSGILLTHGHFDHIKGIEEFLKIFNCTVFIDEKDAPLLENKRLNGSQSFNMNVQLDISNLYLLDDEDEINFENKYYFKVIETPFHTPGSVCYLLKSENAIFTGDTLFRGSIGRTDLPLGDEKEVGESLKKIKVLDPKLNIYPGHGEITTLEHELKTNIYLK